MKKGRIKVTIISIDTIQMVKIKYKIYLYCLKFYVI